MPNNLRGPELLILLVIFLLPAVVPIAIAYARKTTNRVTVLLVALLLSWTCVGWIVALVLSLTGQPEKPLEPKPPYRSDA